MGSDPLVVWMPGNLRTEIHLTAQDTAGAFCLLVDQPPVSWSLPAHRHHNEAETIHVLEGRFEMDIDGKRSILTPGQTVHIPRGVIHAGANVGDHTGRRVVLFNPAGIERFFRETGAPAPDTEINIADAIALAVRHGWEFIDQP